MDKAIIVFTAKSIDRILQEGGTSSWRLNRLNARKCDYAICTRNANADWVEGSEEHHSAFIIGKVKDVVPCPITEDRFLILFDEFALVNIPDVWKEDRNPLRYSSLEEIGIDPAKLDWKPMPEVEQKPEPQKAEPTFGKTGSPLTMAQAKEGLALTFGVSPDSIEITIRG